MVREAVGVGVGARRRRGRAEKPKEHGRTGSARRANHGVYCTGARREIAVVLDGQRRPRRGWRRVAGGRQRVVETIRPCVCQAGRVEDKARDMETRCVGYAAGRRPHALPRQGTVACVMHSEEPQEP